MGEGSNKSRFFEVFYADENEEKTYYIAIVTTSFVLFNINALLILPKVAPKSARNTPEQLWKWRNIANSLIHSILSGFGALFNLLKTPELRNEFIKAYSVFSYLTLSFSVGYFIYDFIDMATHHRRTSTFELLVHHTLVVICYCLALVTKFYQGYALVSLLIEINSVFLHIRQLLIIQGWKKTNVFYKINSYFNIGNSINVKSSLSIWLLLANVTGTFVLLMTLVWMMCWLTLNSRGLNVGIATVSYTAFAQMFFLIHSLKLLKKILMADGYFSGKSFKDDSESTVEGFQTFLSEK